MSAFGRRNGTGGRPSFGTATPMKGPAVARRDGQQAPAPEPIDERAAVALHRHHAGGHHAQGRGPAAVNLEQNVFATRLFSKSGLMPRLMCCFVCDLKGAVNSTTSFCVIVWSV